MQSLLSDKCAAMAEDDVSSLCAEVLGGDPDAAAVDDSWQRVHLIGVTPT
jgi:hypothetical protein